MEACARKFPKSSGRPRWPLAEIAGSVRGSAEEQPRPGVTHPTGICGAGYLPPPPRRVELGGDGWARARGPATSHYFDSGRSLCGKAVLFLPNNARGGRLEQLEMFPSSSSTSSPLAGFCGTCRRLERLRRQSVEKAKVAIDVPGRGISPEGRSPGENLPAAGGAGGSSLSFREGK